MDRSADYANDKAAKEKLLDETNLFKFLLSGISLVATMTCDSELKQNLMADFVKKFKYDLFNERTRRFFGLAMRGFIARVRLSSASTYELFMDFLNNAVPDIPDGADLIDFLGMSAAKLNLVSAIRTMPQVEAFVDWLKDECICDVFLGVAIKDGACHYQFKTEGVKELYEKILAGFK